MEKKRYYKSLREMGDIVSEICGWSPTEINDDDLLAEYLSKLPTRFNSTYEYFLAFGALTLEDVRAQLKKGLESLSEKSWLSIYIEDPRSLYNSSTSTVRIGFPVEDKSYLARMTRPSDVLLLTRRRASMEDITYVIAVVDETKQEPDDNNIHWCNAYILKTHLSLFETSLPSPQSTRELDWQSALLTSIPVVRRLRRFISTCGNNGLPGFMDVILGTIPDSLSQISQRMPQAALKLSPEEESLLNMAQRRCIRGIIQKKGIHLIHGPPGTGKTTTLVAILLHFMRSNIPVIQIAPTNIAVGHIAKELISRIQSGSPLTTDLNIGDLILIGDSERIDLDGPLEYIFLDCRIERLKKIYGWPMALREMQSFLENFPEELKRQQEAALKESESLSSQTSTIDAWAFFYNSTFRLIFEIKDQIEVLLNDFPSCYLDTSIRSELFELHDFIQTLHQNLETHKSEYQMKSDFALCYSHRKISHSLLRAINNTQKITPHVIKSTSHLPSIFSDRDKVIRRMLGSALIVFSTAGCVGKGIMYPVLERVHTAIVDEATQLPEAEMAILFHPALERLILAGDHKQLPATIISHTATTYLYGRSLFERLKFLRHPSTFLLDTQYRMHPEISKFPRQKFYEGELNDWEGLVVEKSMPWHDTADADGLRFFPPFAFFDIDGIESKDNEKFGASTYNEIEAKFVVKYLKKLSKDSLSLYHKSEGAVVKVGIITPYIAQVNVIWKCLTGNTEVTSESVSRISPGVEVQVKSVDGFQGQEKDIILISLVRANDLGEIGFLADERRLNVALTRAKHSCFVFGHSETLTKHSIFKDLIAESKARNVYFDIRKYPSLTKLAKVSNIAAISRATDILNMNSTPSRDLQHSFMRNTLWKMSLTRLALDAIRDMKLSRDVHEKLFGFLDRLAIGYRPKDQKYSVREYPDIVGSRVVASQLAVLWAVALEALEGTYKQIIQVYEIVPMNEIAQALERVQRSLSRHSDDYLKAVSYSQVSDDKKVFLPQTFSKSPKIKWHRSLDGPEEKNIDDPHEEEFEDSLTLAKKYRLSAELIHLIFDNAIDGVEFPITMSEEETNIVNQHESLFILGRSGTGKTTVMTTRMFKREQAFRELENVEGRMPLQFLFTASRSLCAAIDEYYCKLRKSIARDNNEQKRVSTIGPNRIPKEATLENLGNPAFICFADFLTIMDRQLENPFLPQHRQLSNHSSANPELETEEDFIEIESEDGVEQRLSRRRASSISVSHKEVTFDRFRDIYWQQFGYYVQKSFDASVIWTEFQSSIKGSLESLHYPDGKLSIDAFLSLADSRNSTYGIEDRKRIYELFRTYERIKQAKGDWDIGDLTSYIFLELARTGYRGTIIDYVYIDEVQDLTPAQMAIFQYVCRNRNGFVFAGDTAQTISAGVGFRFQSVRDLFYKKILPYIDPTLTDLGQFVPDLHILTQNYRTHSGILNLASSIVEMLYTFFPSMIDKLPKEESLIPGQIPVFLEDTRMDELLVRLFGGGETVSYEFGAEQAIIVRDENTKEFISKKIDTALVLTVYESKGLEFEDVLCYDFFASSSFDKWRVLHAFNQETDFTDPKYRMLCSELKALYVVITRCKKRLWFFDSNCEKRQPAFDIWTSQNLVKSISAVESGNENNVAPLARKSSPDQWQRVGKELLDRHLYRDAWKCFNRAGDRHNSSLCEALIAEGQGEVLADKGKTVESEKQYAKAAAIFEELGEHHRAASLYKTARKFNEAQKIFRIIGDNENALYCCSKGALHSDALKILEQENTSLQLKDYWGRKFALLDSSSNKDRMLSFLECVNEKIHRDFLERYKYYDELLAFDLKSKRFDRVAEVFEQKDDLFNAVEYWTLQHDNQRLTKVLFRMAQPYYCFALANIPLVSSKHQQIQKLLCDAIKQDPAVLFELKFLANLLDTAPIDVKLWIDLLNEIRNKKDPGNDGLDLMAAFLLLQSQRQSEYWQKDPITLIDTLKFCHQGFAGLNKKLTEAALSTKKHECYRIFGLEYIKNPEMCLIDNNVLMTIRSYPNSRGTTIPGTSFPRTEIKLSKFAADARKFVILKTQEIMGHGIEILKKITASLEPCEALLSKNGIDCTNTRCIKVHDEIEYLQEEKKRISFQIRIVEFANECRHLGPNFLSKYEKLRADLLDMLNPLILNLFSPLTILEFKQSAQVHIIFEEYKRSMAEKPLDEKSVAKTLIVSSAAPLLVWYPQLAQTEMPENLKTEWTLWQAFNWLRVNDHSLDPILMSGTMGAKALLLMSNWKVPQAPPIIQLSPRFYVPLLEKFLGILVIRNTRFFLSVLPVRLWIDLVCGDKCPDYDNILRSNTRRGWEEICELKNMLCYFLRNHLEFLRAWLTMSEMKMPGEKRGYIMRALSLLLLLYLNFKHFRKEIGTVMGEVNWMAVNPLGILREPLKHLMSAETDSEFDRGIIDLLQTFKDEFVIVTNGTSIIPYFMRQLKHIRLSKDESVKNTLLRQLRGSSADSIIQRPSNIAPSGEKPIQEDLIQSDDQAQLIENVALEGAPVEEEVEIKLSPFVFRRILEILSSVREMIERRKAIYHPRDRYIFVATEYFKKRPVSSEFVTFYIDNICDLNVKLASILEKTEAFLASPPKIDGIQEIVDEMLTFKEKSESYLALLDIINPKFKGENGLSYAENQVSEIRQHLKEGEKNFGERLKEFQRKKDREKKSAGGKDGQSSST